MAPPRPFHVSGGGHFRLSTKMRATMARRRRLSASRPYSFESSWQIELVSYSMILCFASCGSTMKKSVVLLSSYCPVLWGWSRRGSHESGQVARFMGHMNLDCRKSPVTLNRKLRMQEGCLRVSERTKIMKKCSAELGRMVMVACMEETHLRNSRRKSRPEVFLILTLNACPFRRLYIISPQHSGW